VHLRLLFFPPSLADVPTWRRCGPVAWYDLCPAAHSPPRCLWSPIARDLPSFTLSTLGPSSYLVILPFLNVRKLAALNRRLLIARRRSKRQARCLTGWKLRVIRPAGPGIPRRTGTKLFRAGSSLHLYDHQPTTHGVGLGPGAVPRPWPEAMCCSLDTRGTAMLGPDYALSLPARLARLERFNSRPSCCRALGRLPRLARRRERVQPPSSIGVPPDAAASALPRNRNTWRRCIRGRWMS